MQRLETCHLVTDGYALAFLGLEPPLKLIRALLPECLVFSLRLKPDCSDLGGVRSLGFL
jgi:hypothetical protein